MQIISRSELPALIAQLCKRGARPLTVAMQTDAKLLKKSRHTGAPNPFGDGVVKNSVVNGFLNFDYETSVNRQLGREGQDQDFKVKTNWFEHSEDLPRPLVRNKKDATKLYLQLKSERVMVSTFSDAGGVAIDRARIEAAGVMPIHQHPLNQGTEKPILTFTVSLEAILAITCDGETYAVAKAAKLEPIAEIVPTPAPRRSIMTMRDSLDMAEFIGRNEMDFDAQS